MPECGNGKSRHLFEGQRTNVCFLDEMDPGFV